MVSAIETIWKQKTTDLGNIILRVIYYTEIKKENEKDKAKNVNALTVSTKQK